MIEASRAAPLARRLRDLPVDIETVDVSVSEVDVPSYPDEPRPSSTVELRGRGRRGQGEHVGWSLDAHLQFQSMAPTFVGCGRSTVGAVSESLARRCPEAYDRAAFEAAAIDLALRQADRWLGDLVDAPPVPTRYVVSFTPDGDPTEALREELGRDPTVDAKIDVDIGWDRTTLERLAATGRVAVLDWKCTGAPPQHALAHRLVPEAIHEDPGPDPLAETPEVLRRSVDGPFLRARALDGAPPPAAANVKPGRMGGVLEALDGVAHCAERGISVYFGGMFEIGTGRRQLLDLATLLAPSGPNDIAPIALTRKRPDWRADLKPSRRPGFGASGT